MRWVVPVFSIASVLIFLAGLQPVSYAYPVPYPASVRRAPAVPNRRGSADTYAQAGAHGPGGGTPGH